MTTQTQAGGPNQKGVVFSLGLLSGGPTGGIPVHPIRNGGKYHNDYLLAVPKHLLVVEPECMEAVIKVVEIGEIVRFVLKKVKTSPRNTVIYYSPPRGFGRAFRTFVEQYRNRVWQLIAAIPSDACFRKADPAGAGGGGE